MSKKKFNSQAITYEKLIQNTHDLLNMYIKEKVKDDAKDLRDSLVKLQGTLNKNRVHIRTVMEIYDEYDPAWNNILAELNTLLDKMDKVLGGDENEITGGKTEGDRTPVATSGN